MTFFTADTHFGHANIIKYCDRPFATIGKMDAEIIRQWNETIGMSDIVYHLGDFTLMDEGMVGHYFSQLNGRIRILANAWHHDRRWLPYFNVVGYGERFPKLGYSDFRSKSGYSVEILPALFVLEFPELGDGKYPQVAVLCHYPLAVWDRKHYGAWHLHGHSHGNYQGEGLILDVGVDCNQFQPVSLTQIAELMDARAK